LTAGRPAIAALAALFSAAMSAAVFGAPGAGEKAEILELMDKVLESPSDGAARARLGTVAGRAVDEEKAAAEKERRVLMKEAEAAHRRKLELAAAKKKRLSAWKKSFSKACSLASDADTAAEAVALYEELLGSFPVYSGNVAMLHSSDEKIMGIFLKTVRKSYPYLAAGRSRADDMMLAALNFSRGSERQSLYGERAPDGIAEAQLKKAEKLRGLKTYLGGLHGDMDEGVSFFTRGRWADAADNFGKVLGFDPRNEEALYYHSLAEAKMAASPGTR